MLGHTGCVCGGGRVLNPHRASLGPTKSARGRAWGRASPTLGQSWHTPRHTANGSKAGPSLPSSHTAWSAGSEPAGHVSLKVVWAWDCSAGPPPAPALRAQPGLSLPDSGPSTGDSTFSKLQESPWEVISERDTHTLSPAEEPAVRSPPPRANAFRWGRTQGTVCITAGTGRYSREGGPGEAVTCSPGFVLAGLGCARAPVTCG